VGGLENAEWLVQISVWETGETELESMHKSQERIGNKHYDVESVTDLDTVLAEFIAFIRDGDYRANGVTVLC
jgi:hypothetical protein